MSSTRSTITKDDAVTDWKSLAVASTVTFFAAVQFSLYIASIWPYLLQQDPEITEEFYGYINGVYSLGQAVMCPLFGYWCNRIGQCKLPVAVGVIVMFFGNLIYTLSPVLPFAPKWTLFVSRLVSGCGAGLVSVLKNYSVTASTIQDRSRSISLNSGCFALGLTFGPAIQIFFTPLKYPGISVFGFLVNMYSAPAIFGMIMNGLCMALIIIYFKESTVGIADASDKDSEHYRFYALPKPSKIAIAACITTRFAQMFVITVLDTIGSPLSMTMFNWNKQEAVEYNSLMHAGFGTVGFVFYFCNVYWNVGQNLNHRIGTIIGLLCLVVFHFITFPWWGLPGKITIQQLYTTINGTEVLNPDPIGCRPSFDWCREVPPMNQYLYVISYMIICGFAFTCINICMNTVFSTVLGPRNQGTMQGFLLFSGSFARMLGPLFVPALFTKFGPRPVWVLEVLFSGGSALMWVLFYNKLVPLRLPHTMSAGSSYKNKFGSVHKF